MARVARGELPFVAGLGVAIALFGAAHAAGASGDGVDGSLRSDAATKADVHIDDVKGRSAVVVAGPRRYTIAGTSHTPAVGGPWKVAITATKAGRPLDATVRADALLNGSVVRHIGAERLKDGVYVVATPWPARAVGIPLALRFSIDDGTASQSFVYPVKVRPAAG